jgi:hypothetical protein
LTRQIVKSDVANRRLQRGQLLIGCHIWPGPKLSACRRVDNVIKPGIMHLTNNWPWRKFRA